MMNTEPKNIFKIVGRGRNQRQTPTVWFRLVNQLNQKAIIRSINVNNFWVYPFLRIICTESYTMIVCKT